MTRALCSKATKTKEIFIKPRMFYIRYACATSTSYSNATVTLHGKHAYDFVISDSHPGSLKYLLVSGMKFCNCNNKSRVKTTLTPDTRYYCKEVSVPSISTGDLADSSSRFWSQARLDLIKQVLAGMHINW